MPPAAFLLSPYRWLRAISRRKAKISDGPNMAYDLCTRQETAHAAVRLALRRDHKLELHAFVLIRILSIPKTTSGKIQQYATRDAFLSHSLDARAKWNAAGGLKLMQ
jgi:acyl-CoA synthetase (AMP-forming)/AMP-acid ligase II